MENTVDTVQGIVLDDAAQAPAEEQDALSSLLTETEQSKPAETEQAPAKEPGWIKKRVAAEVTKAEARIRAEYEQRLAPLYESMMEREAQELVRSGEFKTPDKAREYVRLKNGIPVEQQPAGTQRDAQGRFTANGQGGQDDPVVQARAGILAKQAQKIKQNTGLDVMQAFSADPEVKQRVISGEWDFHDVADYLSEQNDDPTPGRGTVPMPMRSPNGAKVNAVSIADMTPEQFQKLQDNLASGRRYNVKT